MKPKTDPEIKRGQRWRHRATGGEARVMGVVEGWVVARYRGAIPFLRIEYDFRGNFISQDELGGKT